jgi:hypothetical protein
MTTPEQPENQTELEQKRDALFEAIQATLREQGTNVQVAGTAPIQQIVTFDLGGEPWMMTVNKSI